MTVDSKGRELFVVDDLVSGNSSVCPPLGATAKLDKEARSNQKCGRDLYLALPAAIPGPMGWWQVRFAFIDRNAFGDVPLQGSVRAAWTA